METSRYAHVPAFATDDLASGAFPSCARKTGPFVGTKA
jgi:hypothetical protein